MYPCLIIPILVGLISALLGYLLGKSRTSDATDSNALQLELDNCRAKSFKLSAELEDLKKKGVGSAGSLGFMSETAVAPILFDADASSSIFGRKIKENDLKIIEGIGPKIEELFNASGITTWRGLSETSVDRCNEILKDGGERFLIHNPMTWPRQAKLAYEGKWRELKDWQETLDGGKE
jgi:hypothetical protein